MESSQPPATEDTPLTVSQLNREARYLLEDNFPAVLVEGEISNVAMPASGHWYLTLKDATAQVRCAMFRNRNMLIRCRPAEGMQVLVRGKISLYEGRGDFQLILERMEELGDGALRRAFEELKQKLLLEGLFEESHKRSIPHMPRHIGVITSPTGAAIRDILSVLRRRFPGIRVTILPVSVQGRNSAPEMIRALQLANAGKGCLKDLDVLLLARGGGSLEDLWSFNDEQLARAIFASELPVVSAVGHEVDFTIADFAADLRAATPSAAAELLSPDQQDYLQLMTAYRLQLRSLLSERIRHKRQQLLWLTRQLQHPGRRLQEHAQRLDELDARLRQGIRNALFRNRSALNQAKASLMLNSPGTGIRQHLAETVHFRRRFGKAILQQLRHFRQSLAEQSHALNAVSPLATLSRGYSITTDSIGNVVRRAEQLNPGDRLITRLQEGSISSTVDRIRPASPGKEKQT
ncbi:MAG: exodeoxyribonuclease VII large subunit [Pseudohongiellaceae bacterium]